MGYDLKRPNEPVSVSVHYAMQQVSMGYDLKRPNELRGESY